MHPTRMAEVDCHWRQRAPDSRPLSEPMPLSGSLPQTTATPTSPTHTGQCARRLPGSIAGRIVLQFQQKRTAIAFAWDCRDGTADSGGNSDQLKEGHCSTREAMTWRWLGVK